MRSRNLSGIGIIVTIVMLFVAIGGLVGGLIFKLVWNWILCWLIPAIPEISYWKAVVALAVVSLLLGGTGFMVKK